MKKTARITFSTEDAAQLAVQFVHASKWFECEPLPDDSFRFTLKDEPGITECIVKSGADARR